MTIISHEFKPGAGGGVTADGREYNAELWVFSDDPEDTGHAVTEYLLAQGFVYGARYNVGNDDLSTGLYIYLDAIGAPQLADGSVTVWLVPLTYKTLTPPEGQDGGGGGGGEPGPEELALVPTDRRPTITTSTVARSVAKDKGRYMGGLNVAWPLQQTRTITNSAGVAYVPRLEGVDFNRVLRVTRNLPSVIVSDAVLPIAWINDAPVTFRARKTIVHVGQYQLKFLGWQTEPDFEREQDFVKVTFEGEITRGSWIEELLDQGGEQLSDSNIPQYDDYPTQTALEIIRIKGGRRSGPVMLNGAAKPLTAGQSPSYGRWAIHQFLDVKSLAFFAGIAT